jgi:hypothetical protein
VGDVFREDTLKNRVEPLLSGPSLARAALMYCGCGLNEFCPNNAFRIIEYNYRQFQRYGHLLVLDKRGSKLFSC